MTLSRTCGADLRVGLSRAHPLGSTGKAQAEACGYL